MTLKMNPVGTTRSLSPQSGRQNLAQGGASEASETLGNTPNNNRARFGGRENLSPAKAGSKDQGGSLPRAALRCTSFRFACPGLNSAVRSADSLDSFAPKSLWLTAVMILFVLFNGCTHRGGGISSGAGGWPPSSDSPAEISSSAQVVKVTTLTVQIAPGGSADAIVRLSIMPGYHINANPATFSYLIATEVKMVPEPDGFCANTGNPIYPPAVTRTFPFAESPLAVYEGEVEIKLPLQIPTPKERGCYGYPLSGAKGSLPITVRVQACDNEKCFPPATLNATVPVEVK